jgi:hypothetical protein
MNAKIAGTATMMLALLFCAAAVLMPLEESYALTHAVFTENGTATW